MKNEIQQDIQFPVIVVIVPPQSKARAYIAYNDSELLTEEESHDLHTVYVVAREDVEEMLCAVTPRGGQTRHQAARIASIVREKATELEWLEESDEESDDES